MHSFSSRPCNYSDSSREKRGSRQLGATLSSRKRNPHIPILIGGGEKVILKLVAQYGDACNVLGDLETIRHKLAVLKTHCKTLGRDFATIHCTIGAVCSVASDGETALALPGNSSLSKTREDSFRIVQEPIK